MLGDKKVEGRGETGEEERGGMSIYEKREELILWGSGR